MCSEYIGKKKDIFSKIENDLKCINDFLLKGVTKWTSIEILKICFANIVYDVYDKILCFV